MIFRENSSKFGRKSYNIFSYISESWLSVSIFLVISLIIIFLTSGNFILQGKGILYPLDDSYIHLALGRTLAATGVWGVTPSHPSAASSSPLWSVFLAACATLLPGMSRTSFSWTPLIGNLVAGVALVMFWRRRLQSTGMPNLATIVLILIIPLPAIAMIGMEHVLHALLATLLAWLAAKLLEGDTPVSAGEAALLALLAGLAVAARYESLALVGTIALLAVWYRRWRLIPAVLLPSFVVVAAFGMIWVKAGGWALPNSFLLKTGLGHEVGLSGVLQNIVDNFYPIGVMLMALCGLLVGCWFLLRRHRGPERAFLVLALSCNVAQFLFGKLGWLFRYEAWLIALDGLAILLAANLLLKGQRRAFIAVTALLFVMCAPRAIMSVRQTPAAAHDRIWEHFGPTFALAPYVGKSMLVNDIGVMAYYGTGVPIDIYGLADDQTLRLKREGRFNSADVRTFAAKEGAHIGEFQICWNQINDRLPAGWQLVEAWTGPRNVAFGDRTIAFMADDRASADRLQSVLSRSPLPGGVQRFDPSSPLVQGFNAASDKRQAAETLCRDALKR